ncbi:MAG: TIGR02466 family protein [Hyphomicrobiaceae bacterium]
MAKVDQVFVTKIYRGSLKGRANHDLNAELLRAIETVAAEDHAGQAWSEDKGYKGYTSYASLTDLTWRMPEFADLETMITEHVKLFAKELDLDLRGRALGLDSLWINVLAPGGVHSGHIHPHSAISGTYYVQIPDGASAIRFEDPRLAMMMAAPPRREKARLENRNFISQQPKPGTLLLWESWLRHEVPMNTADDDRISVSFNYALTD